MVQLRRRFTTGAIDQTAVRTMHESFLRECAAAGPGSPTMRVDRDDSSWTLDGIEDFLEEASHGPCQAMLVDRQGESLFSLHTDGIRFAELVIRLPTAEQVRRVVGPSNPLASCSLSTVFVGHGRDPQWEVLVGHLRDKHGFHVVTYETLARYGQPASAVLDAAARTATAALLVHTAEVETVAGVRYSVPNVAHETGFFAAHLGPERALVLREDSCRPFTNIAGLTELRFSDRNIREVFGDVVAELRRLESTDFPSGAGCATIPPCSRQHPPQ